MAAGPGQSIDVLVALIDALHCGALIADRAGTIAHVNSRMCEMLGLAHADVVGRRASDYYEHAGNGTAPMVAETPSFDRPHEGEFVLRGMDGARLPVILSGRPVGSSPPLSEYRLITAIDFSQQRKSQSSIEEENKVISQLSDTVLEQALELKRYSEKLEVRVRQRTADLHDANMEAIYMLAIASEAKDADTGAHVRRIQHYCISLAKKMGLSEIEAEEIGYSAILHDVGKMSVADSILKKPGPLDPPERDEMQLHSVAGERILSRKSFFKIARQIARSHHENWDGTGYPDGLRGDEIPLPARIVRLADVFDALTSERVYKPAWTTEQAAKTIEQNSGKYFDPAVVEAFKALLAEGNFAVNGALGD